MEPDTSHSAPARGLAVASVGMAFFSGLVFWWFPFGLLLATASLTLGVICYLLGIRGSYRNDPDEGEYLNLGIVGGALAVASLSFIIGMYKGIQTIMGTGTGFNLPFLN